jgi:hypothetical protein
MLTNIKDLINLFETMTQNAKVVKYIAIIMRIFDHINRYLRKFEIPNL